MSKTKFPNATKLESLWTQWEKPTKESSLSLKDLSIKYLLFLDLGKRANGSTNNARQVKLALYKSIIDFYHQETNDRMFKKRWEELHDPKLADIGLEKRLESGIKGKDSANAYVPSISISLFPHQNPITLIYLISVKRKRWMLI
jgi:hypothetical protein